MEKETSGEAVILGLIESFDDIEHDSGVDFTHAKRIIHRFARKHNICGVIT